VVGAKGIVKGDLGVLGGICDRVVSPVNIDSTVCNKCVPKKSRHNKAADAIGIDGVSFLAGKENSHLDAEAASSLKRPAQNEVLSAPKYVTVLLTFAHTDTSIRKKQTKA
jgi:hypothetical protein